jgi:serine/threonine protein kinase
MTEETIFQAALDRQSPADRAAYLDEVCAGNPALRQRVEALLCSHADPDSFLDVPALLRQADDKDQHERTTDLPAASAATDEPAAADDFRALLSPTAEPGALGRLDHYEVLELVGKGGMGVVFKARDTRLQCIVAVKVLTAHLAASGTARQRFFREARSAAAVRDDHVVSIHAVSDDGRAVPYLVMEFIAGVTLERRLQARGPLAVKEVLRIGMQAAAGLAAAHRQGLIHRDVKPANILLENGVERVKITDFGLARAADDVSLSQSGMIAGTALYMSPEQARGQTLDARSDLFSLGGVLYALCTGSPPFQANSTPAVLKRVCEDAPRPIREVNPDVPEWLAEVVDKLLAKEPAERFQSAAELAELLGQRLAQLQASSLPPRPAEGSEGAPPAAPQSEPERRPAARRKRWWMAAGAVTVGILACLVGVAILSRTWSAPSSGQPPVPPDDPGVLSPGQPPVPPDDPRVLTVSKTQEGGGQFRTIQEALDEVKPGMTIRVLDDAVYYEYLQIHLPERHRGVVLEATGGASLRRLPRTDLVVYIRGVSGFTLRGFRFATPPDNKNREGQVFIAGRCPGLVLDRLAVRDCNVFVHLYEQGGGTRDAPLVIQNCTMQECNWGIVLEGMDRVNRLEHPLPCGYVVIRDNTFIGCRDGVLLQGAIQKVHLVGNRFVGCNYSAIHLLDLVPVTADVLVANNTMLHNQAALRVRDDHKRGQDFLKCENIRFQNNLILQPRQEEDLILNNHRRGLFTEDTPGDVPALLNSLQWRFSHNWREITPLKAGAPCWIPGRDHDKLQPEIDAGSRKLGDPTFLRPPKDSPLARSGVNDGSLPAYVGAVPPQGVKPWDWDKTWKMLTRPKAGQQ